MTPIQAKESIRTFRLTCDNKFYLSLMKGQTINYRRKDGSWVSGFFIPDNSTQVSLNSRKYYNYCRNDSSSIKDALAWDTCTDEDLNYVRYRDDYRLAEMSRTVGGEANRYYQDDSIREDTQARRLAESMRERPQSSAAEQMPAKINIKNYVETEREKSLERGQNTAQKATTAQQRIQQKTANQSAQKLKRSESVKAGKGNRNQEIMEKARQSRQAKLAKLGMKKEKSAQRLKIQNYVKSLVPYTRDLSNTRFRSYYGKECLETYGKNNTNEPIGGIIYGNHLKTFNIGPHSRGNDPKHYQTHNTALNFAKRTKLNEEDNWKRLEKEMGKKLGLKVVNNSVKQGKQQLIQEVNDDNMYAIMKEHHQFQKQHKDEIRQLQKDYRKEKVEVMKAEAEQYKQQRVADRQAFKVTPLAGKSEAGQASTAADGMSVQDRMKNQVIYKYVDENGVTRYATDRHAITCYVDLNFPENEQAYTQELINRSPIYPIQVKQKDRHLDQIRKQNYVDSVVNCYPAHYLTPNVDYSQVKWGKHAQQQQRKRSQSRSKSKSIGRKTVPKQTKQSEQDTFQRNKSPGISQVRGQQQATVKREVQFADQRQKQSSNGQLRQRQENQFEGRSRQNQQQIQRTTEGYDSNDFSGSGCGCMSARPGCAPNIKQILMERAQRDPHLASKLLSFSKKYDCQLNNNQPTPLIENDVYDPNNYFPHAVHELNPQLYGRVSPQRIPYAGMPSTAQSRLP